MIIRDVFLGIVDRVMGIEPPFPVGRSPKDCAVVTVSYLSTIDYSTVRESLADQGWSAKGGMDRDDIIKAMLNEGLTISLDNTQVGMVLEDIDIQGDAAVFVKGHVMPCLTGKLFNVVRYDDVIEKVIRVNSIY